MNEETLDQWKERIKSEHGSDVAFMSLALLSYPPIPVYRAYTDGVMISEWVGEAWQD